MNHEQILAEPQYRNWVKAALGTKYLKDGLVNFVDDEIRHLQSNILKDVSQSLGVPTVFCNSCTTKHVKKKKPCPNKICSIIFGEIKAQYRNNGPPSWKNTDANFWCSNHWHIAKCFLPNGGYENTASAADTDCSGLLHIAIHCLSVQNNLAVKIDPPIDLLSKCRQIRHIVFHSPTLELTDSQINGYIDDMVTLLEDKKKLGNYPDAQTAVSKLTELKNEKFVISTKDEFDVCHEALFAIQEAKLETLEEIKTVKLETIKEIRIQQERLDETKQAIDKQIHDPLHKVTIVEARQETIETTVQATHLCQSRSDKKISDLHDEMKVMTHRLDLFANMEQSREHRLHYIDKKKELKDTLCSMYEGFVSTISLSPLLDDISASIDDVFVDLVICDDLVHEPSASATEKIACENNTCYKDIFFKGNQKCKNVYVQGNAGIGKTTFCMKMLNTWVFAVKDSTLSNADKRSLTDNEKVLSEFDVVLFVSLRNAAHDGNILEMVKHQLFEEHPDMYACLKDVLTREPQKCLIILDGLDDWTPPDSYVSHSTLQHPRLPGRKELYGCTVITTARPWVLNSVRLNYKEVDRAIIILGLNASHLLAEKLIGRLLNAKLVDGRGIPANTKTYLAFERELLTVFNIDTSEYDYFDDMEEYEDEEKDQCVDDERDDYENDDLFLDNQDDYDERDDYENDDQFLDNQDDYDERDDYENDDQFLDNQDDYDERDDYENDDQFLDNQDDYNDERDDYENDDQFLDNQDDYNDERENYEDDDQYQFLEDDNNHDVYEERSWEQDINDDSGIDDMSGDMDKCNYNDFEYNNQDQCMEDPYYDEREDDYDDYEVEYSDQCIEEDHGADYDDDNQDDYNIERPSANKKSRCLPEITEIPLILSYLVFKWLDGQLETTQSAIMAGLLECFIKYAEGNKKGRHKGKLISIENLSEAKSKWKMSADHLPECLKTKNACIEYSRLIMKLSNLAFDTLFDSKEVNYMVFTDESLDYLLSEEELEVTLKLGLLSQSKYIGISLSPMSRLSFPHKFVHEYLAAVHIASSANSGDMNIRKKYKSYCCDRQKVIKIEQVMMFLREMNLQVANEMSQLTEW